MMFFNIHNIFKLAVKGESSPGLEKFLSEQLYYFKSEECPADLTITLVPKIQDFNTIFYPNCGRDEKYFYAMDGSSNKVGILSGSEVIAESNISGGFLLEHIIEPLMMISILGKGYSFLHASSVAKNREGILFSALPKTGKTNMAVSLLESGYDFLSNELVLVSDKGQVLPYPKPIAMYPYNLKAMPELVKIVSGKNILKRMKIKKLIGLSNLQNISFLKRPRGLFAKVINLGLREIMGKNFPLRPEDIGSKIGEPSAIKKVFLLFTNKSLDKPRVKELTDKNMVAGQLWANMLREKNDFFQKIYSVCEFSFPEKGRTIKKENLNLGEKIILDSLREAKCFSLEIPEKGSFKDVFPDCYRYF